MVLRPGGHVSECQYDTTHYVLYRSAELFIEIGEQTKTAVAVFDNEKEVSLICRSFAKTFGRVPKETVTSHRFRRAINAKVMTKCGSIPQTFILANEIVYNSQPLNPNVFEALFDLDLVHPDFWRGDQFKIVLGRDFMSRAGMNRVGSLRLPVNKSLHIIYENIVGYTVGGEVSEEDLLNNKSLVKPTQIKFSDPHFRHVYKL